MSAARAWAGRGRGAFRTRAEGQGRSVHVWICLSCRHWHDADSRQDGKTGGRPAACDGCSLPGRELLHFASSGEARHFVGLWMLQGRGVVRGLRHQPVFPMVVIGPGGAAVRIGEYRADASYEICERGAWVRRVEDYKPRDPKALDPVFKGKRLHVEAQYGIKIQIVTA